MLSRGSRTLLKGQFSADQVTVAYNPISDRRIDPAIEEAIEKSWQRQLGAAAEKGMQLYDAEAYRLNAFQTAVAQLILELAPVTYKVHAAMKSLYTDTRLSEPHLDKTLVADSLVRTSDGKYLFGKVDKVVENATYLIGGTCAKARMGSASTTDLFGYARTRVADVLCVDASTITTDRLIGLIQNEVGCVNAIFDTETGFTADEAMAAFCPNNSVSELVAVDGTDITAYLAHSDGYVSAVAGLL